MATPLGTSSFTTSSSVVSSIPIASQTALLVTLRGGLSDTGDFFPFDDLATLDNPDGDQFSFKNLIENGVEDDHDIELFSNGCKLRTGEYDCTTACNDTSIFFSGLETFYNCAALASIAHRVREGSRFYLSDEAERNASEIMGDGSLATFEKRTVLDTFVTCAQSSCARDALGVACDRSISQLNKSSSDADILQAVDKFCPELPAEVDPDIFGPGVLISYVLQVCFSSSLYLLLKAFNAYVLWSQKPQRTPSGGLKRVKTMMWADSSALSRMSIAIATTLVEFQEAQAWFVFAVQIASILAIVVNSSEGTFWGEVVSNAAIAYHISQNAVLPMFLIQVCLHNEGIRNWHTFLGFLVEYGLAIVATTQKVGFHSAVALFKSQNEIAECGFQPSPRTYCAARSGHDGLQINFFPHPLLYKMVFIAVDGITVLVLLVDQFMWTLRRHHKTKHLKFGSWSAGRGPRGKFKRHWNLCRKWFWRLLEVGYLIINMLYLVSLIKVIDGESFAANRWAYGQIIAMTVWGPVVVKLFDLILSGPPKNGRRLQSGPPRLRIDNVLNRRPGTIAEEELDLTPDPAILHKPRSKSVPHIYANKPEQEQGSSDDHREGTSDDIFPDLLEARRTFDVRFDESVMTQRSRSEGGQGRHSEDRPPDSAV